jgi:hypothetical protein
LLVYTDVDFILENWIFIWMESEGILCPVETNLRALVVNFARESSAENKGGGGF